MILSYGVTGDLVKELQRSLHLLPTGQFDDQTLRAVKIYQESNNLVIDGIVGPITQKKLSITVERSRNILDISVHTSATKEHNDFKASDIRKWHKRRGWSDIGYHYVIRLCGKIEKGRPLYKIPAAVKGKNINMIAVCYIGGLDADTLEPKDTRTSAQKESMLKLLKKLKKKHTKAIIRGHKDYPNVHKACPCFEATKEYKDV